MKGPYVRVELSFQPHRDDVGELYESVRSCCETLRPFGIDIMEFNVRMVRGDDDGELLTF